MNVDAGGSYDGRIVPGAELSRITGVVEQNVSRKEWKLVSLDDVTMDALKNRNR